MKSYEFGNLIVEAEVEPQHEVIFTKFFNEDSVQSEALEVFNRNADDTWAGPSDEQGYDMNLFEDDVEGNVAFCLYERPGDELGETIVSGKIFVKAEVSA